MDMQVSADVGAGSGGMGWDGGIVGWCNCREVFEMGLSKVGEERKGIIRREPCAYHVHTIPPSK